MFGYGVPQIVAMYDVWVFAVYKNCYSCVLFCSLCTKSYTCMIFEHITFVCYYYRVLFYKITHTSVWIPTIQPLFIHVYDLCLKGSNLHTCTVSVRFCSVCTKSYTGMIFANICAFGLLCVVHAMRRRQCPRPKLVPHTILVDGSQTASQPHDFLHYTYACR